MIPPDLFWKELVEDFRAKRSLAIKFLLPLIFLLPVALPSVPLEVKAGMLPMAALFLGVFGSSIGLVKMRESKMVQRLALLPRSPRRLVSEYLMANILMDVLQLTLPFLGAVILLGTDVPSVMAAFVGLLSAVVASNGIGVLVAILAGSSGEVHLYAALSILLVGGASGLFIMGAGTLWAATVLSPFAALSSVLVQAPTGWPLSLLSIVTSVVVLLAAIGLSGRIFAS